MMTLTHSYDTLRPSRTHLATSCAERSFPLPLVHVLLVYSSPSHSPTTHLSPRRSLSLSLSCIVTVSPRHVEHVGSSLSFRAFAAPPRVVVVQRARSSILIFLLQALDCRTSYLGAPRRRGIAREPSQGSESGSCSSPHRRVRTSSRSSSANIVTSSRALRS